MTGEPVRTSASLFVKVELGGGGLLLLSTWVASKKEVGQHPTGRLVTIPHGGRELFLHGTDPGTGTRTVALMDCGIPEQ